MIPPLLRPEDLIPVRVAQDRRLVEDRRRDGPAHRDGLTIVRAALTIALALGLLAGPPAAGAQQAGKVWRIGLLDYGSPDPARLAWWKTFRDRLRELGYVEGQNVVFQPRWGNGQVSRLQGLATELVAAKVDIFVTAGNPASLAAKQVTGRFPS